MSIFHYEIARHNDIDCLYLLEDSSEKLGTYIPVSDILTIYAQHLSEQDEQRLEQPPQKLIDAPNNACEMH